MTKKRYFEMCIISLFASLLCLASYVALPMPFSPSPITLHTFVLAVLALLFSPKVASLTVVVYIAMGLCGLPVFAGGTAGFDKIFGPFGGYYFGFFLSVLAVSLLSKKIGGGFIQNIVLFIFVMTPIQHFCAVIFMCLHGANVFSAFISVSLPFILSDIIKALLSALVAEKLKKIPYFSKK